MKQEAQGCFTQLDRSLALPRVRARVLRQQLQTAWREAEFRKLDQALAAPELQVRSHVCTAHCRHDWEPMESCAFILSEFIIFLSPFTPSSCGGL